MNGIYINSPPLAGGVRGGENGSLGSPPPQSSPIKGEEAIPKPTTIPRAEARGGSRR